MTKVISRKSMKTNTNKETPLLPKTIAKKLAGERAKERFLLFKEAIKKYGERAQSTLDVYALNSEGEMIGSNIFALALLDSISPKGTRRAGLADLLRTADADEKYFSENYVDVNAVVLRSLEDSLIPANNYLARTLAKKMGIKNFNYPVIITDLRVKDSWQSKYGLILVPSDATQVIKAPELSYKNNNRRFSSFNEKTGLPLFRDDYNGKWRVSTKDNGLSRLYIYCHSDVNNISSNNWDLSDSDDNGRVVEISGEPPKLVKKFPAKLPHFQKTKLPHFQETKTYFK